MLLTNPAPPVSWWRHQMETFSALLAICAGNSPVPGEFPAQRPVTRSFDIFFDLRLNKRLSKQSWGWWFETLSCSLWRHRNVVPHYGDIKWPPWRIELPVNGLTTKGQHSSVLLSLCEGYPPVTGEFPIHRWQFDSPHKLSVESVPCHDVIIDREIARGHFHHAQHASAWLNAITIRRDKYSPSRKQTGC